MQLSVLLIVQGRRENKLKDLKRKSSIIAKAALKYGIKSWVLKKREKTV
jgi:hypothetical protein